MQDLIIASAQFEARDGDKACNLSAIATLAAKAAADGASLALFHECSISGYTFLENLSRDEITALAEPVPAGPSIARLTELAGDLRIAISAGLVEIDNGRLYNCQAVVTCAGLIAKHRKIHEFVSDELDCGDCYTVFDHDGWRWGILTCYDNNLPENSRMTAMLGAQVILMPHVTGCLPSPMPGRGIVEPEVWRDRRRDPVRCRQEFDGPKGRGWIMRWLPARAWENGVYAVYANPIGEEGGTIKPGGAMILDPFGEVIAECRALGDEIVAATIVAEKLQQASGGSYIRARRPELYGRMLDANPHLGPGNRPEVYWKAIRKKAGRE